MELTTELIVPRAERKRSFLYAAMAGLLIASALSMCCFPSRVLADQSTVTKALEQSGIIGRWQSNCSEPPAVGNELLQFGSVTDSTIFPDGHTLSKQSPETKSEFQIGDAIQSVFISPSKKIPGLFEKILSVLNPNSNTVVIAEPETRGPMIVGGREIPGKTETTFQTTSTTIRIMRVVYIPPDGHQPDIRIDQGKYTGQNRQTPVYNRCQM